MTRRINYGVWLALSLALLAYVWAYGDNVPWQDDFRIFVPVFTGVEAPNLDWLWYRFLTGQRMSATKAVLSIGTLVGAGFTDRYALLSVPLWLAMYYGWILYGGPSGRRMQAALAVVAAVALLVNFDPGRRYGESRRAAADALRANIARGLTSRELADQHYRDLLPWNRDLLRDDLELLRHAKPGPFADTLNHPSLRPTDPLTHQPTNPSR